MRHARLPILAAVAIVIGALSASAQAHVKQRFAHNYTTQINMIDRVSTGYVGIANTDWNTTEAFGPVCRQDYPDPKARPYYILSVQSFESSIPGAAHGAFVLAKNERGILQTDTTKHKAWFTNPKVDAKVLNRAAHIVFVALSQEDAFALGKIQTALGRLAAGDCNPTEPMDEAHTLIDRAYADLGTAFKLLRSLLP